MRPLTEPCAAAPLNAGPVLQLALTLPATLPDNDLDLSRSRFTPIKSFTSADWKKMIKIFADMLAIAPKDVLIVLDGLDLFDAQSTNGTYHAEGRLVVTPAFARMLVQTLRTHINALGKDGNARVLLIVSSCTPGVAPLLKDGGYSVLGQAGAFSR